MNFKNIISGLLCSFLLYPQIGISQNTADQYLLVGTYTRKNSEGIYVYKFNTNTGDFSRVSVTSGIKNPSFLTISPDQKFVYAVSEIGEGAVHAYSFNKNAGTLTSLNTQSSGGADPCHISIDKTGKWVLVGNYSGGNLSVLPVEADGSLGKATQTINHEGKGPNAGRQEKPHVHSVNIASNNRDIFVPELKTLFEAIDEIDYENQKLKDFNYVVMGQVCVGEGYRSMGFFDGMYQKLREELSAKFEMCVTDISTNNTRSLKAHARVGFIPVKDFHDAALGEVWRVVVWDWRSPT